MCGTRLAESTWRKNNAQIAICAASHNFAGAISLQLRHISTIKKLVKQQCLPTCPHNMVNFGPLVAEICWRVWGTPANFNGFHVLAALLHGTLVVGVSQTLPRWTENATYIRQGGHRVEHRPFSSFCCVTALAWTTIDTLCANYYSLSCTIVSCSLRPKHTIYAVIIIINIIYLFAQHDHNCDKDVIAGQQGTSVH